MAGEPCGATVVPWVPLDGAVVVDAVGVMLGGAQVLFLQLPGKAMLQQAVQPVLWAQWASVVAHPSLSDPTVQRNGLDLLQRASWHSCAVQAGHLRAQPETSQQSVHAPVLAHVSGLAEHPPEALPPTQANCSEG